MSVLVESAVRPATATATRTRVDAAVAAMERAAAELGDALGDEMPTGACERVLIALERHGRKVAALRLKVVSAARRADAPGGAGFASAEAWVAQRTRTTRTAAARQVALAGELESGHDATASALEDGLLSTAHAAVILGASQQLPATVSPAQRDVVEQQLVLDAQRYDPDQLRRRARRVLEAVEPDQKKVDAHENELVRSEEEAARAKCAMSLHDNGDGTTTGHFTVPTLAASILRKVIESMTAPRRMRHSVESSPGFDWRHRRGLALAELLEHLPTDHLHPKTAATVVVTLDHKVLDEALKVAGLDTGEVISAGQARRLACGAGLIPAVLGERSVALDLGRESRLFSESQRVAAGLQYDTCAADGCDRPYAWCELHHRHRWSAGGRTDLRDAVPLCHWHHQRIHDHRFRHDYQPDGTIRFRQLRT